MQVGRGFPARPFLYLGKGKDCRMATDGQKKQGRSSKRADKHEREHEPVVHNIDPGFDERSRVLLLGTMPSPKSREVGFYYGHPQNRFWRVLAELFGETSAQSIPEKCEMLLRHRIALWDVLASCEIEGASDASIRNARPNDLSCIFQAADIQAVFTTGTRAAKLYRQFCEPSTGMPCVALPSTSAANAHMNFDDLVKAYRVVLDFIE